MREEYLLVFLTLLVRLGLGTLIIYLIGMPFLPTISDLTIVFNNIQIVLAPETIVGFVSLALTACGLGLSLFHVGKPGRILNTFANKKSAMSWEAIIAPPLLCIIFAYVLVSYFYPTSMMLSVLRILSLCLAISFIFVTGKVYHLRARPSWSSTLVLYEYFISASIFGVLGLGSIYYFFHSLTYDLSEIISYLAIVLILIELLITYSYRFRAIRQTPTAKKMLYGSENKNLYFNFVALGLFGPIICAILLIVTKFMFLIPIALCIFFFGATIWRVLFFRSATLIKITPDIKI